MPALTYTSRLFTSTYVSAHELPQQLWDTLRAHPRRSNVILSHAEKALTQAVGAKHPTRNECWITCSTSDSSSETIDFVLSCVENSMGPYPIFIFSTRHFSQLDEEYLLPRISLLTRALYDAVSVPRVFSVFAPNPVAEMFADLWVDLTGVPFVPQPYYAATFTVCTRRTHIDRSMSVHPSLKYDIRPAVESDIDNVAELCYGFALGSEPFILTREGSVKEATLLVRNSQVWVHGIQRGDEAPEIASIVCTTRPSTTVAAVTKVYTNPRWRKLGCAERLVRRVCKHLLKTKESVVLYVAHDNKAAAKVYHRVGFVGLDGKDCTTEDVEPWLEIGFDRDMVELGHW